MGFWICPVKLVYCNLWLFIIVFLALSKFFPNSVRSFNICCTVHLCFCSWFISVGFFIFSLIFGKFCVWIDGTLCHFLCMPASSGAFLMQTTGKTWSSIFRWLVRRLERRSLRLNWSLPTLWQTDSPILKSSFQDQIMRPSPRSEDSILAEIHSPLDATAVCSFSTVVILSK